MFLMYTIKDKMNSIIDEYGYLFPYKTGFTKIDLQENRIYIAEAEIQVDLVNILQLAIYSYGPIRINISDAGGGNNRSDTNLAYFTEHGNELIFP